MSNYLRTAHDVFREGNNIVCTIKDSYKKAKSLIDRKKEKLVVVCYFLPGKHPDGLTELIYEIRKKEWRSFRKRYCPMCMNYPLVYSVDKSWLIEK